MKSIWERLYPYAIGVIAASALAAFAGDLSRLGHKLALNPVEIFNSVFDVSTIITGLLFSVYVLAISPGGGFIERIFATRTFLIFRRYVIEAMILGSVAAALSLPLRALESMPSLENRYWFLLIVVWGFFAIASFLAFFRVSHVFFVFAKAGRPTPKNP